MVMKGMCNWLKIQWKQTFKNEKVLLKVSLVNKCTDSWETSQNFPVVFIMEIYQKYNHAEAVLLSSSCEYFLQTHMEGQNQLD